jgi:hypothetical protein
MPSMTKVQTLSGQKLPALFTKLWSDGAFEQREAGQGSVAILQHWLDFLPITPDELVAAREEMVTVFQVAADRHQLVPFARTEQGDYFCFYYGGADGDAIPVVYLPLDEDEARVLAKDLGDFLFRAMLDCATKVPVDSLAAARAEFSQMCEALRPYLSAEKLAVLIGIVQRETKKTLLKESEARQIIKTHLQFPRLNKRFVYTA